MLADILSLLAERAPALRAAGVQSFVIDGVSVILAPAEIKPDVTFAEKDDPMFIDPMNDPMSFGLKPGAKLPGYSRPEDDE